LVRGRRAKCAAERLLRKLIRKQARAPRVLITDKLGSYGAARKKMSMKFERRQQSSGKFGSNRTTSGLKRFNLPAIYSPLSPFTIQSPTSFHFSRKCLKATEHRTLRSKTMASWQSIACSDVAA